MQLDNRKVVQAPGPKTKYFELFLLLNKLDIYLEPIKVDQQFYLSVSGAQPCTLVCKIIILMCTRISMLIKLFMCARSFKNFTRYSEVYDKKVKKGLRHIYMVFAKFSLDIVGKT